MRFDFDEERNLKEAFGRYRRAMNCTLPTEEELEKSITMSPEAEDKIMALIYEEEKEKKGGHRGTFLKAVAGIAAIFCIGTALFFSFRGIGVLSKPEEGGQAQGNEISKDLNEAEWIEAILPTYLPEGFNETEVDRRSFYEYHIYTNSEEELFILEQAIKEKVEPMVINEENSKRVVLNDQTEGICYIKDGEEYLYFEYNGMLFSLHGALPQEELIKIAQSMLK